MAFKVADGYVEIHSRLDRDGVMRDARRAADDVENEGKKREGSFLKWLFTVNPSLMRLLEAPIGSIFGSPIIFAAAVAMAVAVSGFLGSALTTAILGALGAGILAAGIWALRKNKELKDTWAATTKSIENSMARAAQPLLKPLLSGIKYFEERFVAMEPQLKRIFAAVGPMIKPLIDAFVGFLENMLPGIERAMPGLLVLAEALGEHLPGLGTAFGDFFATLAENGPLLKDSVGLVITWLDILVKVAGPILVYLMYVMTGGAIIWHALVDAIEWGVGQIKKAWNAIPGLWDKTWGAVKGFFTDLWNTITGFFSDTGDKVSSWWNSVTTTISNKVNEVVTFFTNLPNRIWNAIMGLPDLLGNLAQQAFDRFFFMVGYGLGLIVKFFIELPDRISSIMHTMWDKISNGISSFFTWWWNTTTSNVEKVIAFFNNLPARLVAIFMMAKDRVTQTVSSMITSIVNFFTNLPPRVLALSQRMWDSVSNAFSSGSKRVFKFVQDLATNVFNFAKSWYNKMYNFGKDIIRGVINGIGDMMSWAVDKAKQAAAKIAEGFKKALGIGSPSKLMRVEVGRWIPPGIAQGIQDNQGVVMDAISRLAGMYGPGIAPTSGYGMATPPAASGGGYGPVTLIVQVDRLQEIADVKAFLDGQLSGSTKADKWNGNIYEMQGAYERSYR